jgi:type IV pilus assembly protein PilV
MTRFFLPARRKLSIQRMVPQRGSSLVEVLVAVMVISFGLLGVAGISATTLSYNKAAQIRLAGFSLVNDYADRARLNIYGFDLGKYDIALADAAPGAATGNADETNPKTAAEDVAKGDRNEFINLVKARIPQGRAVVVSTRSAAARDLDIWVLWKEPQASAGDKLFTAGQSNCPSSLSATEKADYSCMYFKVGL